MIVRRLRRFKSFLSGRSGNAVLTASVKISAAIRAAASQLNSVSAAGDRTEPQKTLKEER